MKNFSYIFLLVLILCCFSCVGQKEEVINTDLQLIADKLVVSMDNDEEVYFSVLHNGVDVTDESLIYDVTEETPIKLASSVFIPQAPGIYRFIARYQSVDTQIIEIQATQEEVETEEDFVRKFLIMKFTATWCVNCPKMSDAIKTLKNEYPGQIVDMAIHHLDEMQVDVGKKFVEHFNINAIPVAVVNFNKNKQTSVSSSTLLSNFIKEIEEKSLEPCGIKIETTKDETLLNVDISCTIREEGNYKMVVAIVQDNISKAQTGAGTDYIHHGVLKDILHESIEGDELGECQKNQVVNKKYTYPLNKLDENSKYRVISYVMNELDNEEFVVNTVTECNI
jgi:thiol-disulfide isomerase/thioredoxin